MKLGTEVGLEPGDIVLDGDSAPPKGAQPSPIFWSMSVVAQWLDGSVPPPQKTAESVWNRFGLVFDKKTAIRFGTLEFE